MTLTRMQLTFLTILLSFGLTQCVSLADVFRGNTRRDRRDYDLDDKREYRKYYNLKKIDESEQEKLILKNIDKAKIKKSRKKNRKN